MADYSKKALYLRKELKQFEVEYDLNALKAAAFTHNGVAVDTGIDLPAGITGGGKFDSCCAVGGRRWHGLAMRRRS